MKFDFATWFVGTRLADVVLAATALELVGLGVWHTRRQSGLSWRAAIRMLLPGAFLTLALRMSLSGGGLAGIALCLLLAGVAHGVDLANRWKRAPAALDLLRQPGRG